MQITPDEMGLNKKLINRSVTEYLCYDCLGAYFKLERKVLLDMVERFREAGCHLFVPKKEQ